MSCVWAGLLESAPGWQQAATVDARSQALEENHAQSAKQLPEVKKAVSLTVTGPSHLVQTVHEVRTIDQGGKILAKTHGFAVGNRETNPATMHRIPVSNRPAEILGELKSAVAPQMLRYSLHPGFQKHIVVSSSHNGVLHSKVHDFAAAPHLRKYIVTPQFYKLAVLRTIPKHLPMAEVPETGSYFQIHKYAVLHPTLNHSKTPPATSHASIPLNVVAPVQHPIFAAAVHQHAIQNRAPHAYSRPIVNQIYKHTVVPQMRGYPLPWPQMKSARR